MTPNTLLYLSAEDVRRALSMPEAIHAMREAFIELSSGKATLPPRTHMDVPEDKGVALVMPCHSAGLKLFGLKWITLFAENRAKGLPMIQSLLTLSDGQTGKPLAVMDGGAITALRTGAVSGLATDLLARHDAEVAAVFGAGVQARTQLEAVCCVRPIRCAKVYDADAATADRFAEEMTQRLGVEVRRAASSADALEDAAVVCTVTTSRTPVFQDSELPCGAHINAVGSYKPDVVEIPAETVCRARIVVDHLPSILEEAGDLLVPLRLGLISEDRIRTELGEVLAGRALARQDAREITLFKSVGVATEDLYAAAHAVATARKLKLGLELPR